MMRLLPIFLLLPLALAKDYSVSVTLDAKWNDTPYVAEISEFLASEDPSLFWRYLDSISVLVAEDKLAPTEDGEAVLAAALSVAKARLSEGHVSLLELALASRAYSAAVEMNNQLSAAAVANFSAFPCAAGAKFWITFAGRPVCSLEELQSLLQDPAAVQGKAEGASAGVAELRLRTDKVFGRGAGQARSETLPSVVLYGDLRYKEMYLAHEALKAASLAGKVEYVFRHRIVNINNAKTRLNGYGVELAIKSTEYKAMDDTKITKGEAGAESRNAAVEEQVAGFDFSVLRARYPNLTQELNSFRQHLMETATEIVPLKAWQLQDLSFQAAQRVANAAAGSREALVLETLEDVSQNYPLRAHSLSKISVAPSFRSEVLRVQTDLDQNLGLAPGTSAFFVNGFLINDHDPFAILELLRREQKLMQGLHNMGVKGTQINKVLRTQLPDASSGSSSSKFALDIREMPIAYLNDLEDGSARYYGWPTSVRALLEQTFPGMLRRVAKNLFHLILVVDPADPECWAMLRYAQAFVTHAAPVRIGLVWVVPPASEAGQLSVGEAMVRAFNFIKKEEDEGLPGVDFLLNLINQAETAIRLQGKGKSALTVEILRAAFVKRYSSSSADRVFDAASSKFSDQIEESRRYMAQSGLSPRLPQALLNGALLDRKQVKDMFEETVVGTILEQTPFLQKEVYEGRLTDHNTALDVLMTRPEVVTRLNQRILESEGATFLNLGRMGQSEPKMAISALHDDDLVERLASSLHYVSKKEDNPPLRPVSLWLATDITRPAGRAAVLSALKLLRSSSKLRLALIHTAPFRRGDGKTVDDLVHTTQAALELLPASTARLFLAKLLKEENVEAMQTGKRSLKDVAVSDMDVEEFSKGAAGMSREYADMHAAIAKRVLHCSEEAFSAVVANGKVLGPLTEAQIFGPDDLRLLERVTLEIGGAGALADRFESMSWAGKSRDDLSELAMRANALLQSSAAMGEQSLASVASKRRYAPLEVSALAGASEAVLRLFGDLSQPTFELVAVLDPLSRDAQKLSSILRVLRQAINCNLHVVFSCKSKLSEPPLKNFYRLAWAPRVNSPEFGRALFAGMAGAPLLTLGMDAPHSWLVAAVRSPTDLDNIRLNTEPSGRVAAHFELEHLLLEGHCVDTVTGQPPRGLQFTLGGRKDAPEVDTIVMANLGYFQLKANPGAWFLQLRAGRSADIYDISGHEFADSLPEAADLNAVVDSLRSKIIRVRVSKKKDKLDANLLGEDEAAGGMGAGLWDSISNAFGGSKKKAGNHEVLNIFSVASGHLYERFLRIMMLSVLKHTKQPVKFWFLKNYLSPTFKHFIPHLAKAYNFQYELVEYRWPRWLHQQTEKQRIIWGYKILFLDVLFPLDVQKIIFVDADQIVRTDLQELADLDLEGAPYGYTPFCDSRREMDGFRFWKSGYWAGHLGHRRYHISALYVVDLLRFRRLAAGDRLRGQYQGLSQDPNSLSNLDQDLPNNMIHQVPIKSLPQEWLWCDTWCAKEDLARAKTIDLCNNPMTKEPKLSAALRIVPEWKDYDQDVKKLWDKVYGTRTAEINQTGEKKEPVEQKKKKEEL